MKRKAVIILVITVLLLLSSCGGIDWTSDGTELRASYEGTEFIFEPSWDGNTAEGVVRSVSDFLRVFGLAEGRTVQVCGEDAGPAPEAATLRLEANKAPELADYWALYQSAKENIADYGMAYAAVAAVCEARKLCPVEAEHTDAELAQKLSDRLYMLDLTLPLLEEHFVDTESASLAREATIALGRFALSGRSEDELLRLIAADEAEKTALKNDWLRSAGSSDTYEPLALLPFERSEGEFREDYPYLLRCGDAVWYFAAKDVQDEGYADFMRQFLHLEELRPLDFADAREALRGYIVEDIPPVDIYTAFFDQSEYYAGGRYFSQEKRIKVYCDWIIANGALLHEYIHYLRISNNPQNTLYYNTNALDVEGVTEEIAVYECENRMRLYFYTENDKYLELWRKIGIWDEANPRVDVPLYNTCLALHDYLAYIGNNDYPPKEIDLNGVINEPLKRNKTLSTLSYPESAALMHYMFETYGRDEVLSRCHNTDELWELCGKKFPELYEDFGAWLTEQDKINGWGLTD